MREEEYFYDPYAFLIREGIELDKHIVCTYRIEVSPEIDSLKIAEALAAEATTGTWMKVPTETTKIRERYKAKVLGVYEISTNEVSKKIVVNIAHPIENFDSNMPMPIVLTGTIGSLYPMANARIKMLDVSFPKKFVEMFRGPKFGISNLRKDLKVQDRPFVATIIKPKLGMSPEGVAKVCYEAAVGGSDLIKDDEMQANPPYCTRENRLSAVLESLDRAYEETGKKCLYALNITDRVDKMLEISERAVQAGANCILVNYLTAGYSILRSIAEDQSVGVPILAHPTMALALTGPENMGTTSPVLNKFLRLCGADLTILYSPYGKMYQPLGEYFWSIRVLRDPLHQIKSVLPALSGGVHPGLIAQHVRDVGIDIMMIAGGGVLGHPHGIRAGIKAMLQAAEAASKGIPLKEAAKEHKELKTAVDLWGIFKRSGGLTKRGSNCHS
ncbi:MAG: RuBisCO large subunit C-terminal-like domain-containing protein [Candidatus Geothermarchaeales archaeon]